MRRCRFLLGLALVGRWPKVLLRTAPPRPLREGALSCSTAPPSPPPGGGLQFDARAGLVAGTCRVSPHVVAAQSASNAAAGRLAGLSLMLEAPSRRGLGGAVGLAGAPSRRGRGGAVR